MASNFVPNLVPRARVLGEVGSAFKRNFLVTLGTILTITVSLTMLGAVMLVQRQVNFAQRVLYADVELSIFLNDDITPDQLRAPAVRSRGQRAGGARALRVQGAGGRERAD